MIFVEHHPEVGCCVVAALGGVGVVVFVFGDEPLEEFVEVGAGRGIHILIDDQRGAVVLEKDGGYASGDAAGADETGDFGCDFVGAFSTGGDGDGVGVDFHRVTRSQRSSSINTRLVMRRPSSNGCKREPSRMLHM